MIRAIVSCDRCTLCLDYKYWITLYKPPAIILLVMVNIDGG